MNLLFATNPRSGLGLVSIGLPIVMFLVLSLVAPKFFSFENLGNVSNQITALLIVTLGQMIVALVAGIDISVGSVVSLTSVIVVSVDPEIAISMAVLAGLAVGLVNGFGVVVAGVHPLIMTLASMTFLQGFALLIQTGAGGTVPSYIQRLSTGTFLGLPMSIVWSIIVVAIVSFIIYRTRFGLRMFAIGANARNVELSGVRTTWPRILCYVLCSLSGVLAGVYLTGRIATGDPMMGQSFSLDSVTAVALGGVQLAGGTGSVLGAVFGSLTLGLITNGMNLLGISPFFRGALTGLLLVGAISLQRRKAIGI
ncbi:ABC transporter permease [Pseudophaeobacter sp. TrK17]|uniref:ABC transporter permease n=1 Tax=Pseudophaeobacter sp. TrK17 TaxID=2815167 RepID=UPI0035CEFCC8